MIMEINAHLNVSQGIPSTRYLITNQPFVLSMISMDKNKGYE